MTFWTPYKFSDDGTTSKPRKRRTGLTAIFGDGTSTGATATPSSWTWADWWGETVESIQDKLHHLLSIKNTIKFQEKGPKTKPFKAQRQYVPRNFGKQDRFGFRVWGT